MAPRSPLAAALAAASDPAPDLAADPLAPPGDGAPDPLARARATLAAETGRLRRTRLVLGLAVVGALLVLALGLAAQLAPGAAAFPARALPLAATGALGGLLGAAELASRYRDAPRELLGMGAAWLYVALNAAVGVAAFLYLDAAAEAATRADPAAVAQRILLAGLGGALALRSSVARTRVGDAEVAIGPAFLIDVLLGVTDREIDRRRALDRLDRIPPLMREVPATFAAGPFVAVCAESLQNLPASERDTLDKRVASVMARDLPAGVAPAIIGMILAEYVGADVLARAVAQLAPAIARARATAEAPAPSRPGAPDAVAAFRASAAPTPAPPPPPDPAGA